MHLYKFNNILNSDVCFYILVKENVKLGCMESAIVKIEQLISGGLLHGDFVFYHFDLVENTSDFPNWLSVILTFMSIEYPLCH